MANLSVFDPMASQMNKLFQNWLPKPWAFGEESIFDFKIDLSEKNNNYIVRADIPGVKKEDIRIDVHGNRVSISAEVKAQKEEKKDETLLHSERYEGRIYRSFTLDSDIDDSKAEAVYKDGVLELTLPKRQGSNGRRLTVG